MPQTEGTDFERIGQTLLFNSPLAHEGHLGRWRWVRMALGIAGSYRKHDTINVVYTVGGRQAVAVLAAKTD